MDGSQRRKSGTQLARSVNELHGRSRKNRRKAARRRRLGGAIEALEQRNLLTFAIDLFADINALGVSSNPDEVTVVGDTAFFVADDGEFGSELWKTDGTPGGTLMIKDILPGPDTSDPRDLTRVGNEVFFTALDINGEVDLWKSDGTESGTVEVFDADAAGVYYIENLTHSNGKLFFTAQDAATGNELWSSDGTSVGTAIVRDINQDQSIEDGPKYLTDVNGTLFFTSYEDGYDNRELWKSDGTVGGTVMVADLGVIPGTPDDPSFSSDPQYLTNIDGVLYFAAEDWDLGIELFKSDGSEAGTMMIQDLNPSGSSYPTEMTGLGGEVLFAGTDSSGERHLYKTDGATISLVADTTGGFGSSNPIDFEVVGDDVFFSANGSKPASVISTSAPILTDQNSRIGSGFAGVVAQVSGGFPYQGVISIHDSSTATFFAVAQCCTNDGPGWAGPAPTPEDPDPDSSARIGDPGVGLESLVEGDLYIQSMSDSDLGSHTWEWTISDPGGLSNINFAGFVSGNQMNNENNEGVVFELFLNGDTVAADTLEIDGDDGELGNDKRGDALDNWYGSRDDANLNLSAPGGIAITTATVRMSLGIIDGNGVFQPRNPDGGSEAFVVNATLSADLGPDTPLLVPAGRELHKTDGTMAGTELVKDIVPIGDSNPFQLTEVDGKLFFAADDVTGDGLELWVSDGTEAGTIQLVDSLPGTDDEGAPLDGAPTLFEGLGGELLFATTDVLRDRELWVSDGTPVGTTPLININSATGNADVKDLIANGTDIYFVANDGINGEAIWRADTVGNTVEMIADVTSSAVDGIDKPVLFNPGTGQVVFYHNLTDSVYITNGANDPILLSNQRPIPFDDDGTLFAVANGRVFFVANDGSNGEELWSSNGVSQATMVNAGFVPGATGSEPRELTAIGNTVFFAATTSASTPAPIFDTGRELFRTTGSSIDLVNETNFFGSSDPEWLTEVDGQLLFVADDGFSGREVYYHLPGATGTPTLKVVDLNAAAGGSTPKNLTDVDGVLYFTADNGTDGFEPYRVDIQSNGVGSTEQIANINPGGASSDAYGFFPALGEVYFVADDGTNGAELWRTTGAAGNATFVSDIRAGTGTPSPVAAWDSGKRLVFAAAGSQDVDRELWSTDGTDAKTFLIKDLYPPEYFGSDPESFVEIDNRLYFAAADDVNGRELFVLEEVPVTISEVIIGGEVGAPVVEQQRSTVDLVTVVFDDRVEVPVSSVKLFNRDTNTEVTSVQVSTRIESDGKTYIELTFAPGPSVVTRDPGTSTGLRNSLADGNYQLTILTTGVESLVSGGNMAVDQQFGTAEVDTFFRRFGDDNGDRVVGVDDFGQFAQTFLKPFGDPAYNAEFDFDGDGDVDGVDYGLISVRLNKLQPFS